MAKQEFCFEPQSQVLCSVFWNTYRWLGTTNAARKFKTIQLCFFYYREQSGAILYPGRWSREGCETIFNSTMTVCKCNHLTHFAILLSARPLSLSPPKLLSLQIIGNIGVSISLVAMAATVFVFLFLKYVQNLKSKIEA